MYCKGCGSDPPKKPHELADNTASIWIGWEYSLQPLTGWEYSLKTRTGWEYSLQTWSRWEYSLQTWSHWEYSLQTWTGWEYVQPQNMITLRIQPPNMNWLGIQSPNINRLRIQPPITITLRIQPPNMNWLRIQPPNMIKLGIQPLQEEILFTWTAARLTMVIFGDSVRTACETLWQLIPPSSPQRICCWAIVFYILCLLGESQAILMLVSVLYLVPFTRPHVLWIFFPPTACNTHSCTSKIYACNPVSTAY